MTAADRTYREAIAAAPALGPVACQGCRRRVVWLGVVWIDALGGTRHDCAWTGEGPSRAARALSTPATEAGPSMEPSQGSRQAPLPATIDGAVR